MNLCFCTIDQVDKISESADAKENNVIVTELSAEAKLRVEGLQSLVEPCDRKTYGINSDINSLITTLIC